MPFWDQYVEEFIPSTSLKKRIVELGAQITQDYQGKELMLVGILKGSAFFLTELAQSIDLPLTMEFMGLSSYSGGIETTGEVRVTHDLSKPMHGKHVLVVEDIIDTGLTMKFLLENFASRHPSSIKIATLLEKPARAKVKIDIHYTGFTIDDKFVVGFGLDYGEKYRNLPFVGVMRTD
jgi:hypoxanthine phosphoribosyltransferase